MNYFLTGGLGFVGRHLTQQLLSLGHQVTAVGRSPDPPQPADPNFCYLSADTTRAGEWQSALRDQQVVVNLAGKSIFTLWTEQAKEDIRQSRIQTTRNLVDALPDHAPITFCSASAVGYYGDRGEDILTEETPPGDDFLAGVAQDWEKEALRATDKGARVVLTRFGIVLGKDGGAMPLMRTAFRWFSGGQLGSGRQWFPWIHINDLVAAFLFVIAAEDIHGPTNFCAPEPVRNQTLTHLLGQKLHRPTFMPAPAFMIRLALGELGQSLLSSQRAIPARLQHHDFLFAHPTMSQALDDLLGA